MLNKELLLATEGRTAGHIKLTVGDLENTLGYSKIADLPQQGSVNKIPTWGLNGKPIAMMGLYTYTNGSSLLFDAWSNIDATNITITVVEKGLTATLLKNQSWLISFDTNTKFFNSSDVGKTYTIVFDPEPTGYV